MERTYPELTDFESRWLAEAVRLCEIESGAIEDIDAVAAARDGAADLEGRIVARAAHLGRRKGMIDEVLAWRHGMRIATMILVLVALVLGIGTALAVTGDSGRPINVVWALGGLLGVHLLSLALWLASMFLSVGRAGGAVGRAWLWLGGRIARGGQGGHVHLAKALAGLYRRTGLLRWWVSATTHGFWTVALSGALLGLLLTLSVRSYGFVWETTILSADVFVRFVEIAGRVPAWFGFAVPDAASVRASGAVAMMDDGVRHAWSSWLAGCLVVYGILPRVLLWALCSARFHWGRNVLRLDPALPGYAGLAQRLMPASERIGVTDAAPAGRHHARIQPMGDRASGPPVLAGVELRDTLGWPPPLPPTVRHAGVLDSREQRKRVVSELALNPPSRLLIACDPRLSPDRGSLELIAELSRHSGECRVWLVRREEGSDPLRPGHWREGLERMGLDPGQVMEAQGPALSWLGGRDAG